MIPGGFRPEKWQSKRLSKQADVKLSDSGDEIGKKNISNLKFTNFPNDNAIMTANNEQRH